MEKNILQKLKKNNVIPPARGQIYFTQEQLIEIKKRFEQLRNEIKIKNENKKEDLSE